jgi:hypothetical protein
LFDNRQLRLASGKSKVCETIIYGLEQAADVIILLLYSSKYSLPVAKL